MINKTLEVDYLIIGAGTLGLAFADVILTETEFTVAIVDRRAKPGGHWNDAYSFVRLHQPSANYGVTSKALGNRGVDQSGFNKGLYELATAPEICTYFDELIQQDFLPSGRVQYFPLSEYTGDGQFTTESGKQYTVTVKRKIVDATFSDTAIPATHPPKYAIDDGVTCAPVNDLPSLAENFDHYVVVGSGKTGIDACQWLLENNISPDKIRWIMPRDSWFLNRRNFQPGDEFFTDRVGGAAKQMEIIQQAESIEHLYLLLEEQQFLMRIDTDVMPAAYRCATITELELEALRSIKDVVRLGRIKQITQSSIELEQGQITSKENTLYIDCSATGIAERPPLPVFKDNLITIQGVRTCQPCLSAALIALIDSLYDNNEEKNALCQVVPYPRLPKDWITMILQNAQNHQRCSQDKRIRDWLSSCRLDPSAKNIQQHAEVSATPLSTEDVEQQKAISQRLKDNFVPAIQKLHALAASGGIL